MGEGNKGRGEGSHNVCCIPKNNLPQLSHVSRQEGIKSGPFSPSLSLCSPLMPANQPVGDIIILEPGVTVGRMPGAGSLVHVWVCLHVRVCGSWGPSGHIITEWVSHSLFKHAPWAASPYALSLLLTHTLTLTGSRYPVDSGETPDLTYLFEYCQWLHTSLFVTLKIFNLCSCTSNPILLSKLAHWAFESRREHSWHVESPTPIISGIVL